MEKSDITIIGVGVVGLAASFFLSRKDLDITTVEKFSTFGQETSSRNSEVIHTGLYYPKNTLKSQTCIRGKELLYEICLANDIPHKKLGKLVIAFDKEGEERIKAIYKNAIECGVKDLRVISKNEIKKIEPSIEASSAIFSPDSGIVDSHKFMQFLFQESKKRNVNFAFSVEVIGINRKEDFYEITVREPNDETFSFNTKLVINCAGLFADKISEMVGIDPDRYSYRIHYCKGEYFRIRNPKKFQIEHLIYPPPTNIDLGIHITPDIAGGLRLGPDAEYIEEIDYNVQEEDKDIFINAVSKFLPSLTDADVLADTAGIRPKLQGQADGFRDFVIREESEKGFPNFVNVIGIESPGLTSALRIGEIIKNIVDKSS